MTYGFTRESVAAGVGVGAAPDAREAGAEEQPGAIAPASPRRSRVFFTKPPGVSFETGDVNPKARGGISFPGSRVPRPGSDQVREMGPGPEEKGGAERRGERRKHQ